MFEEMQKVGREVFVVPELEYFLRYNGDQVGLNAVLADLFEELFVRGEGG